MDMRLARRSESLLPEGKEARGGGTSAEYTVLFDGDCPLCRRAVGRLRSWDRGKKLRFLPAADPEVEGCFPWISAGALQYSLHLVGPERRTWEGAGAVEQLIRILPGWGWAARFFKLPGARWAAQRGYRWIAENRLALSCGKHCGSGDGSTGGISGDGGS